MAQRARGRAAAAEVDTGAEKTLTLKVWLEVSGGSVMLFGRP